MSLTIYAANIHQGGGRTLLLSLLAALKSPATVYLDSRLSGIPPLSPGVCVIQVKSTVLSRLYAEWKLFRKSNASDVVLCFGNLPPLFANPGKVYIYLQNRYLLVARTLLGFSVRIKLRIFFERFWLRFFLRNSRILVQTETMAQEVFESLGHASVVLPFAPFPCVTNRREQNGKSYDFIYVASGEPHKNHSALISAWEILAHYGISPSLCLTLDEERDASLLGRILERIRVRGLNISNTHVSVADVSLLYKKSGALIYPSLFESFGLPLLEANAAGLNIIASERDYVRDVVEPVVTFDPASPLSIARAVMRYMGNPSQPVPVLMAEEFIHQLETLG